MPPHVCHLRIDSNRLATAILGPPRRRHRIGAGCKRELKRAKRTGCGVLAPCFLYGERRAGKWSKRFMPGYVRPPASEHGDYQYCGEHETPLLAILAPFWKPPGNVAHVIRRGFASKFKPMAHVVRD